MRRAFIMLTIAAFLFSGCAMFQKTEDPVADFQNNADQVDFLVAVAYGSFTTFCAEGLIAPDICTQGDVIKSSWDAQYTTAKDLILQLQQGKVDNVTVQKAVQGLTKLALEIIKKYQASNVKAKDLQNRTIKMNRSVIPR